MAFVNQPLFQRIIYDFCLVIYYAVTNLVIPLTQQYLYYFVGQKYSRQQQQNVIFPDVSGIDSRRTGNNLSSSSGGNNTSVSLNGQIEEEATALQLYLNIAELFTKAICVLLLGFYSDTTGRRCPLIWLACLGNVAYGIGFLLPLYISGGDVDHPATKPLLYTASVLFGLTGNLPGFTIGISSYVSDTDTVDRRSLRLSTNEMYYCVTLAIGNYASSRWIQSTADYAGPLWLFTVVSLLLFFLCFILLKEPEHMDTPQSRVKGTLASINGIKDLFRCDTAKRKTMWLVMAAFIPFTFVHQGQQRTTVLFLKNDPLRWNDKDIGTYYLVTYLIRGMGSLPGFPILSKCLDETVINILGVSSLMVSSVILAFAQSAAWVYLSSVVRVFSQIPWGSARSLTSKQAGPEEQGSVYALIHVGQLLMLFLGTVTYNAIFFATLTWMNGFIFAISVVLLLPPVMCLVYTRYFTKSSQRSDRLPLDTNSPTESTTLVTTQAKQECFRSVSRANTE